MFVFFFQSAPLKVFQVEIIPIASYKNPNFDVPKPLLMVQKSGSHQLRLVVHPIISRVLYIPGWLFGISSINSSTPIFT